MAHEDCQSRHARVVCVFSVYSVYSVRIRIISHRIHRSHGEFTEGLVRRNPDFNQFHPWERSWVPRTTRCKFGCLVEIRVQIPMKKFIKSFSQISMADVGNVGGKNASLGEMIRALQPLGVNVPDGFATTTDAYSEFLRLYNLIPHPQAT